MNTNTLLVKRNARIIAFYLPQFHPIPENDKWWGKGFTEWTNVKKAKPLFKDHYQPRIPTELGYYDLRDEETREAQAKLAKEHGIEGFCYWHYWFGNGKRLLDKPFNEVLQSGKPDFPFCLGWANETWQGFDFGTDGRNILLEQKYPGEDDIIAHFYEVLPAFLDSRYIKIDGKPLFYIYKPSQLLNPKRFIEIWQALALKNGLNEIFFVGQVLDLDKINEFFKFGFNAINTNRFAYAFKERNLFSRFKSKLLKQPYIFNYKNIINAFEGIEDAKENIFPTIIPNWDHTPRTGIKGTIFHESSPQLFKAHVENVLDRIKDKKDSHKIIILKSWNEWAEGNYMEPDERYGREYLEVLRDVIFKKL